MDSPPISRIRFWTVAGASVEVPLEWRPYFLEVVVDDIDRWADVSISINGRPADLSIRKLAGAVRVVAGWDLSGAGRYGIEAITPDGVEHLDIRIEPAKISSESYATMLDDLDRLPGSIALALKNQGALEGFRLDQPSDATVAQEVERLRKAVHGVAGRPGLASVLDALSKNHHEILRRTEHWVDRGKARRPHPTGLIRSIVRHGNLDDHRLPIKVLDTRVEHTADVYENQLVGYFAGTLVRRLRRVRPYLRAASYTELAETVDSCEMLMTRKRRLASFLDGVSQPTRLDTPPSMVMLRVAPYRAALEGWLDFLRTPSLVLDDAALDAPLENLPSLYELWGTLHVVEATLQVAAERGFSVREQNLVKQGRDGAFLRVIGNGAVLLDLRRGDLAVRLRKQESYGKGGSLRSVSYTQRPDITFEVYRDGVPESVVVLDPKYKLVSEDTEGWHGGKPKKVDIDKMHAYRDAIRDGDLERVVTFAATMYPGRAETYGPGLAAIRAFPGEPLDLDRVLELALPLGT